jgi:hypothetical protein
VLAVRQFSEHKTVCACCAWEVEAVGFDAILSFGPDCRAKHQILRAFPKERCPSSVFDWQVTPIRAVRFYLANDFHDTFNREDLQMSGHHVVNRKLRTNHIHAFPKDVTADRIDRHYSDARARHDHLCENTRAILRSDRQVLICLSRRLPFYRLWRLHFAIRRYAPNLRFTLLNGPANDRSRDIWTGNDAAWDRHLAPFARGTVVAEGNARY